MEVKIYIWEAFRDAFVERIVESILKWFFEVRTLIFVRTASVLEDFREIDVFALLSFFSFFFYLLKFEAKDQRTIMKNPLKHISEFMMVLDVDF